MLIYYYYFFFAYSVNFVSLLSGYLNVHAQEKYIYIYMRLFVNKVMT